MSAARRTINHATGYHYTRRGDVEEADHVIARYEADIARQQAEVAKWQAIRAGLLAEGGPIADA